MFYHLIVMWFNFVQQWGYLGVFLLMALESSIVPIPSEIVMPPAAFWAAQGKMELWGVVAAGTAGSYFGSIICYVIARWLGRPVVERYGKFFLIGPDKVRTAEAWVTNYGSSGVFFARLLPVVRHLISIPAGILKMKVPRFSAATVIGAFVWCLILSWFGRQVIGGNPELLSSPQALITVLREKLHWFVAGVVVFGASYAIARAFMRRIRRRAVV